MCEGSKNKVVLDFCHLTSRPPPRAVKQLVVELGLKPENLHAVVNCRNRNAIILELASGDIAANIVARQLKYQGLNVPLYFDDSAIVVSVHDIPTDVSNDSIAKTMSQYGEVLTIVNDRWRNFFPGVLNGVRILRVKGLQAAPKCIMVGSIPATVVYKGQKSAGGLDEKKKKKMKTKADKKKKTKDKTSKRTDQQENNPNNNNNNNNEIEERPNERDMEEDNDGVVTDQQEYNINNKNTNNNNYNNEEENLQSEEDSEDSEKNNNNSSIQPNGSDTDDNEGFEAVVSKKTLKHRKRKLMVEAESEYYQKKM